MKTTLAQIIAARSHRQEPGKKELTKLRGLLEKDTLFSGTIRRYEPLKDGDVSFPNEELIVQMRVSDVLEEAKNIAASHIDLSAMNEIGNCEAKADLVLGPNQTVFIEKAPVTLLLQLERYFSQLRDLFGALPTLPTDQRWTFNEATGEYETTELQKIRTSKVTDTVVLYEATKEHPAQTQLVTLDRPVGTWFESKRSTAVPITVKKRVLKRIDNIIVACKKAREKANMIEVQNQSLGAKLFDYIVGDEIQ